MSVTISSDHSKKTIDGMKLAAISLGCAKNRIDTEEILGYLAKRGVILTDDHQHADIIIVNTCGFIEEAQQESIDTLLGLTGKHRNHTPIIIAAGCLVEVYGSKIIDSLPEIAGAIGVHSYHHLEQMLDQILSGQRVVICDTPSSEYSSLAPRILTTPVHSAAVKIAEGCSNRCHYCRIPSIRGPYRSRPVKEIVSEIESLINNGTREINLVAQDTTAYGTDSEEFPDLAGLIREILSLKNNFWLRLMYAYPSRISDHLIELIVTEKRICKYLDIPIQHANSRMIQQMGRHYDKGDLVHIVEKLKSRMPELALRTTCMVGFPGETQRQFQEMLNFIQQY
ncbi:MAG TPA: MiaB/RimO family radical SAM methylthiotransferase, partial [Candidatus Limnocylindrales bacterium]|nr:MiaB/RimO family radical SAM methylthiotransferase [Candidatus Limnocylindrales bacterium]